MKSLRLSLLLFLVCSPFLIAQKIKLKDNFLYLAEYNVTAYLDSLDSEFRTEEIHQILIGAKLSAYAPKALGITSYEKNFGNSYSTPKARFTEFPFIIYKDKYNNQTYFTKNIGETQLMYAEDLNQFNWKIKDELSDINGYACQKAELHWKGRDYIAWFATALAIPEGPFKFFGLPGLIISIEDTEGDYSFQLAQFSSLEKPLNFTLNLGDFVLVSKSKFLQENERYMRNPMGYVNNPNITISPEVLNAYKKSFEEINAKRNNRLEVTE